MDNLFGIGVVMDLDGDGFSFRYSQQRSWGRSIVSERFYGGAGRELDGDRSDFKCEVGGLIGGTIVGLRRARSEKSTREGSGTESCEKVSASHLINVSSA